MLQDIDLAGLKNLYEMVGEAQNVLDSHDGMYQFTKVTMDDNDEIIPFDAKSIKTLRNGFEIKSEFDLGPAKILDNF